ncbi:MAG: tetratricopeptide repeat protein [Pseudomonadota bacterium]|nr:tetratricopeptide repeat protein [Pseudomonadota bacterium]
MGGTYLKRFFSAVIIFTGVGFAPEAVTRDVNSAPFFSAKQPQVGKSHTGHYLAGRQAEKMRDFSAASRYLQRALKYNPDNIQLLKRTFLSTLAGGNLASAVPLARRLVTTSSPSMIANLVVVIDEIRLSRLDDANNALNAFPDGALGGLVKPLLRAWILAGQGREGRALTELDHLKKRPGLRVLYELHAGLLSDFAGNSDIAARHYKGAFENGGHSILRVVQGLGRHFERTGQAERAKTVYEAYMREYPGSVVLRESLARIDSGIIPSLLVTNTKEGVAEILFNISTTMDRENTPRLALIFLRLATYLRPDLDVAYMLIGGILNSLNRYDDAILAYRQVPAASPLNWSARLKVADSFEALGRDEDAIKILQSLVAEGVTRPGPLVSLGDLLRSNKKFVEAIDAYSRALNVVGTIDQRHWTILYSRGIALERSRQWKLAEKDFQRALELNPEQPYVLNYLGYSWVDQGINLARARKMIERAVKLRPNDGYIVDSLGWLLFRLQDFEGAVGNLERAVELRPQDPIINDHLGDAYWRVGRYVEARFQWRRVLLLKPDPGQVSVIEIKLLRGLIEPVTLEKDG